MNIAGIATGYLSDGRMQVFFINQEGTLFTRLKESADSDADWTDWSPFPLPSGRAVVAVAAGSLEDRRLQLFLVDETDQTWSCWKTSPEPYSDWTEWTPF